MEGDQTYIDMVWYYLRLDLANELSGKQQFMQLHTKTLEEPMTQLKVL